MRYMLLIIGDESRFADVSEEDMKTQMQEWVDYTEDMVKSGAFVSGEGLQPTAAATTLRMEGGERLLTDGPFAETKEQVGGFYVVECKDLDEAIEWAARLPSNGRGGITEIRPVMDYEAAGMEAPEATSQGAAS